MKALYNPRFIGVALLLMSLIAYSECVHELHCECPNTRSGIYPGHIKTVLVKKPGVNCPVTEVIATLKNGQKVCLDPDAPMVKNKILTKVSI
ncbi:chemokine vCXCL7 [Cercopithecine betaherpesvirus 5]|uniref:Chemokine vCXCL7 n=1 Tax=Simian cytomegalovirus (strain Colburn) TaxID=50292 RepID=G8XTI8_SCMVC|nr:chemokine vCXCL7 [Cercopithecine betaherpesvirus 5]AEV80480.1 chemokine vCXCL7 [Cercopithecine betaherpesvirus 5]